MKTIQFKRYAYTAALIRLGIALHKRMLNSRKANLNRRITAARGIL